MADAKYKTQSGAQKYADAINEKFPEVRATAWYVFFGDPKPWGVKIEDGHGRWCAPPRDASGPRIRE